MGRGRQRQRRLTSALFFRSLMAGIRRVPIDIDDSRPDLPRPTQSHLQEVLRREGIPFRRQHEINCLSSRNNGSIKVGPDTSDAHRRSRPRSRTDSADGSRGRLACSTPVSNEAPSVRSWNDPRTGLVLPYALPSHATSGSIVNTSERTAQSGGPENDVLGTGLAGSSAPVHRTKSGAWTFATQPKVQRRNRLYCSGRGGQCIGSKLTH
jgi:hypothetical protein